MSTIHSRISAFFCISAVALAIAASAHATALFEHDFVSSSTGTRVIGIGDTISFESFITIAAGTPVSLVSLAYTGDIDASLATAIPCPPDLDECFVDTAHHVTGWSLAGATSTPYSSLGVALVEGPEIGFWESSPVIRPVNLGDPVFTAFAAFMGSHSQGSFYEGTGERSLIGTVTITADTYGQFDAGVLIYPGVTGVYNGVSRFASGLSPSEVSAIQSSVMPLSFVTGAFSVDPVPEPSTALLLTSGLVGFALAKRRPGR